MCPKHASCQSAFVVLHWLSTSYYRMRIDVEGCPDAQSVYDWLYDVLLRVPSGRDRASGSSLVIAM